MTAWYNITEAETDPGAPPKSELWKAWWKNPIAITEGAVGAPYMQGLWHPFDSQEIGDGNDGSYWDAATDGAVVSVETPSFQDGYEYAIELDAVGLSDGSSIRAEFFQETSSTYTSPSNIAAGLTLPDVVSGLFALDLPRIAKFSLDLNTIIPMRDQNGARGGVSTPIALGSLSKISRVRISPNLGTLNEGRLRLLRRREYLSGVPS